MFIVFVLVILFELVSSRKKQEEVSGNIQQVRGLPLPYVVLQRNEIYYRKHHTYKDFYLLNQDNYYNELAGSIILSFKLPLYIFKETDIQSIDLHMQLTPSSNIKAIYITDSRQYLVFLNKHHSTISFSRNDVTTVQISLTKELVRKQKQLLRQQKSLQFLRFEVSCASEQEARELEVSYIQITTSTEVQLSNINRHKRSHEFIPTVKRILTKYKQLESVSLKTKRKKESSVATCSIKSIRVNSSKHISKHVFGNAEMILTYCAGTCKRHNDLKMELGKISSLGGCCVPTGFKNVMYLEIMDGRINSKSLLNGKVKGCTCK